MKIKGYSKFRWVTQEGIKSEEDTEKRIRGEFSDKKDPSYKNKNLPVKAPLFWGAGIT